MLFRQFGNFPMSSCGPTVEQECIPRGNSNSISLEMEHFVKPLFHCSVFHSLDQIFFDSVALYNFVINELKPTSEFQGNEK